MGEVMCKESAERYLGLTDTYDRRVLRKAYAREARRWHPDLQPQESMRSYATKRMAKINEAYAYLKSLFDAGAKTLTAGYSEGSRGAAYGAGSRTSWQSTGRSSTYTGRQWQGASRRKTSSTPPPPPAVVHTQPAGVPVAPEPEPEPAPELHHCLAFRIVEHFPWRVAFLALILLLFISPDHAGIDYLTHFGQFQWILLYQGGFLDFLLWQCVLVPVAVWNLFTGTITDFIQLLLLELIAWFERLAHKRRMRAYHERTLS